MKFLDILKDSNRNLLRNKGRTFLTILAIFIGSFVIILANAISTGVNKFISDQISAIGGEGYIEFMNKATYESAKSQIDSMSGSIQEYKEEKSAGGVAKAISNAQIEKLKAIPGVKADSIALIKGSITPEYIREVNSDKRFVIANIGVSTSSELSFELIAGTNTDPKTTENQIMLSQDYVTALGYKNSNDIVGKYVAIAIKDSKTSQNVEILGKVTGVMANGLLTSLSPVRTNTAYYNAISDEITKYYPEELKNEHYTGTFDFDYKNYNAEDIKNSLLDIDLIGITINDEVGVFKSFLDVIVMILNVFGGIALLAAAIGIINTLYMSVQERTREIGLDKALGMSSGKVFLSFALEAAMLGFWGSVFGLAVSFLIGTGADTVLHRDGAILESFPTLHIASFSVENILIIVALVMAIALLAGTLPAKRAAKKDPIEALRYE